MYVPRTQMTFVLIGKGFVLEGWPSNIEVSWVLGICLWFLHQVTPWLPLTLTGCHSFFPQKAIKLHHPLSIPTQVHDSDALELDMHAMEHVRRLKKRPKQKICFLVVEVDGVIDGMFLHG